MASEVHRKSTSSMSSQVVAQVSLPSGPSSQASPSSTTPSPQEGKVQLVRHASGSVSALASPSSHSSPSSSSPSPQVAATGSHSLSSLQISPPSQSLFSMHSGCVPGSAMHF